MISFNAGQRGEHQGGHGTKDAVRSLSGIAWVGAMVALAPNAARAEAPVVVWMADEPSGTACAFALGAELAGRGAQIVVASFPPGADAGTRSRTAQATAIAREADAALWVEAEGDGSRSVRAVAADGGPAVWAPVPGGDASPRVIALIGVSLLDELLAEPTPISATLVVRVGHALGAPGDAVTPSPARRPPASAAPRPHLALAAPPGPPRRDQRRDLYLELAPMFAVVAGGVGGGVGGYPLHNLRLAIHARLSYVFIADLVGAAVAGSVAYVTDDDDGRLEVGLESGMVAVDANGLQAGFLAVAFAGLSWGPAADVRLGVRLSGGVAYLSAEATPTGLLDFYLQVMP